MDSLVIHSGARHGHVAEVTRSRADQLSVGRGYGNDLIISDVHISPEQVLFVREEEDWILHVLDHTNPVLLNDKILGTEPTLIRSGDKLTLGRTRLGLYSADHPLELTRKLVLSNWIGRYTGSTFIPLLFLLAACLLDLGLSYFESSTDLVWKDYAYSVLFMGVVVVAWAGLWSLAGRLIRHQHHFGLHLMAASATYALLTLLTLASIYFFYPVHSTLIEDVAAWMCTFVALTVVIRLNLLLATHVERPLPVAALFSAVTLAVWFGLIQLGDSDNFQYTPEYSKTLKPPILNVGPTTTSDEYFSALVQEINKAED
jgi:pSer/pThr/pTyr-binding forkhead associated (FHA) protein